MNTHTNAGHMGERWNTVPANSYYFTTDTIWPSHLGLPNFLTDELPLRQNIRTGIILGLSQNLFVGFGTKHTEQCKRSQSFKRLHFATEKKNHEATQAVNQSWFNGHPWTFVLSLRCSGHVQATILPALLQSNQVCCYYNLTKFAGVHGGEICTPCTPCKFLGRFYRIWIFGWHEST